MAESRYNRGKTHVVAVRYLAITMKVAVPAISLCADLTVVVEEVFNFDALVDKQRETGDMIPALRRIAPKEA